MANFDGIIDPASGWPDVPQLSTDALILGGADGPMNAQAVAIVARLKHLDSLIAGITGRLEGTAAPTSGTYTRKQIVWNTEPSPGGVIGWVCVASGSPGTWKAFGNIAA